MNLWIWAGLVPTSCWVDLLGRQGFGRLRTGRARWAVLCPTWSLILLGAWDYTHCAWRVSREEAKWWKQKPVLDHFSSHSSGYITKNSDHFPGHLTCCCVKKSWSHFSALFFPLHLIGHKKKKKKEKNHKSKDEQAFMIMSSSAPSFKHFCGFWVVIYNLELNRPIIPLIHLEKLITDSALLLWLGGGNSNHITIGRQYYFLTWL